MHCVGTDFKTLRTSDDGIADAAYLARRSDALLAAHAAFRPHVIVTELFPFGRRQLSEEFLALLEAARATRPRPAILSSIRDILQPPSKPQRAAQTLERLGRYYDGVLVHADESVIPLDASWPVDKALARRLDYTGYVADRRRALALPLDAMAASSRMRCRCAGAMRRRGLWQAQCERRGGDARSASSLAFRLSLQDARRLAQVPGAKADLQSAREAPAIVSARKRQARFSLALANRRLR
ncbi:hypothetical protein SAMN05519103_08477 [Rhizobiales bacterium GAS113]|nr:hypothetical protein SAMN05519103_08477 [Rhizobiales bacterium GAS113]